MLPHLKFPLGEQRKFVESVFEKSGLKAQDLAKMVNISSRTIRDWKREKYTITQSAVHVFSKIFEIPIPQNEDELVSIWQKTKIKYCQKGGLACYKKYGNFSTPEGRKKGGSKTLAILRQKGVIPDYKHFLLPTRKSSELAEFVGIMLGDGGLTKSQAKITLNTEADKDYILFVNKLGIKLFHDKPTISPRKDCKATNLCFSGILN